MVMPGTAELVKDKLQLNYNAKSIYKSEYNIISLVTLNLLCPEIYGILE
jgi:hypothetical protein